MINPRSFRIKLIKPDMARTVVAEIIVDTTSEGGISDVEMVSGAEGVEIEEVTDKCEFCESDPCLCDSETQPDEDGWEESLD